MQAWVKCLPLLFLISLSSFAGNCLSMESADSLAEKIYSADSPGSKEIPLAYYSDYFSFVGEDAQGRVAFALDNNRGRDGESFQAEHFLVLHDERKGWMRLFGNEAYPNPGGELARIPDSEFFKFRGSPDAGMEIESSANGLHLAIEPIPTHLENSKGRALLRMGSAAAVLQWQDRTIRGRVIYEYLFLPRFNRLSRSYPGLWKDFHGIYLRVAGGGDFYYHSQKSELLAPLVGETAGFYFSSDREPVALTAIDIRPTGFASARGTYQWPVGWSGDFERGNLGHALEVTLSERNTISNWITGGFAMGILTGEISGPSGKRAVYGLGELLI